MPLSHSIPSWLKSERRFEPGTISISATAQGVLRAAHISSETLIARHCSGDFGDISESDSYTNETNLPSGGHVTSVYSLPRFPLGLGREQIWVCSLLREGWTYICIQSEVGNVL